MKIEYENKVLHLAIREIASLVNQGNNRSIMPIRMRSEIGKNAHKLYREILEKQGLNFKSEFPINYKSSFKDWTIELQGRADIVYEDKNQVIVEEVKSVVDSDKIDLIRPEHEFQLKFYGNYFLINKKSVTCYLVLFNPISNKLKKHKINLNNIKSEIATIFDILTELIEIKKTVSLDRKNRSSTINFPFDSYRNFQEDMINTVSDVLSNNNKFLLSAPTGIGKTIGSFYPCLKYSLGNDLRLFVTTSKTTQQRLYEETIKLIQDKGGNFSATIITAKDKMCKTDRYLCKENNCPLLENYEKYDTEPLIKFLLNKKLINSRKVKILATKNEICPFELQLDVAYSSDVIVGDYNYIFHPFVKLQRLFNSNDFVLIIDEAHNLHQRANKFYSPSLFLNHIEITKLFLNEQNIKPTLKQEFFQVYKQLVDIFLEYSKIKFDPKINNQELVLTNFDDLKITNLYNQHEQLTYKYIKQNLILNHGKSVRKNPLINFNETLRYFTKILNQSINEDFKHIYNLKNQEMKIYCISSHKQLRKQIKLFTSVIAQSATLEPLSYFQKILGFPKKSIKKSYPSPFPKENKLFIIYPKIYTTYDLRDFYFEQIASLIAYVINIKSGNYLAFFPSFKVLKPVSKIIKNFNLGVNIIIQEENLSDTKRKAILRHLRDKRNNLLFAVYGGIFSEGIDYLGEMAIGAFIIGPGLPMFSFEQELTKKYYDTKYGKGFEYAYKNIGINKIIQSAGRIFRSEMDTGFVILIGNRFANSYYLDSLPKYWEPKITDNPIDKVKEFWKNHGLI